MYSKRIAADCFPAIVGLIARKIGLSSLHFVLGCGYFGHVLDGTFLRSPWQLRCIFGSPPFSGENHFQLLCIHPSSATASLGSGEASWRSIELLDLA